MRRKLYLIISDGGGNTPLRGVHIDKDNFLNFFKSPEGGAWKDDEILVFENNNFDILKINDGYVGSPLYPEPLVTPYTPLYINKV